MHHLHTDHCLSDIFPQLEEDLQYVITTPYDCISTGQLVASPTSHSFDPQ